MATKKSLFSKPSWAAKSSGPANVERPIFQQNVYEDILEERRKKELRKAAKQKEKEQIQRNSETRETRASEERPAKKQRVSDTTPQPEEDEDDDFDARRSDSDSDSASGSVNLTKNTKIGATTARSPGKSKRQERSPGTTPQKSVETSKEVQNSPRKKDGKAAIVIDEDEDDDEDVTIQAVVQRRTTASPAQSKSKSKIEPPPPPESESESDPDDDPYIKELKRKAREEAKAKRSQLDDSNTADRHQFTSIENSALSPDDPSSTTVKFYIHTIIPSCQPIVIARRPSQSLEDVHKYFCEHHKLNENLRPKIFFTWRNQRLFNSTTARSILQQLKWKYGRDNSKGMIELEAVTDEIHTHRKRQQEENRKRAENPDGDFDGQNTNSDNNDPTGTNRQETPLNPGTAAESTVPAAATAARSPGMVIKLTPDDTSSLSLMQLRVHSDTKIERIVRGYKSRMGIDPSKEVYLVFEGERLDESSNVDDAGFEDGDTVDVRCK